MIYALNFLILGILITFVSPSLAYVSFFNELAGSLFIPYRCVSDWILRAYQFIQTILQEG